MDDRLVPGLDLDRAALDRARISRDARFDGRFFIGVKSTGIYCRPICPARSPKPANIRYFATAAAAAEAGFRPCLRCRPEAAPASPAWLGVSAVVRRALRLIEQGALDDGSVGDLAARLGIGPRHLHRLFVQHVGASPLAVAQTRRLHFAKRLIDETDLPMTEVALESGYGSLRRFNAALRETYRRCPSDLRCGRRSSAAGRGGGIALRLAYRKPYDWQATLDFLSRRAVPELESVESGYYSRTIVQDGEPAQITVHAPPDENALVLEARGAPAGSLLNLVSRTRRTFDLLVDPLRIVAAFRPDPLLAPLVRRCPGLRIPGAWDGFECALRAVLGQGAEEAEQRLVSRLVRSCGSRLSSTNAPADTDLSRLTPRSSGRRDGHPLAELAEAWRPWRGYAALHLWREMELPDQGPGKRVRSTPRRRSGVTGEKGFSRPAPPASSSVL
jgi:AraC family transcriptional regulator of adaptative response / DNA-3-methyladenine glycosylase II